MPKKKPDSLMLAEEFDTAPEPIDNRPPIIIEMDIPDVPKDNKDDKEFARQNMIQMSHASMKALHELINSAVVTQDPDLYAQVANMVKTLTGTQKELLGIVEKLEQEKDEQDQDKGKKTLYLTTTELQKRYEALNEFAELNS